MNDFDVCRRLWASVLIQAGMDATRNVVGCATKRERERAYVSAQNWFRSDVNFPGSYRWCCDLFGLDHKKIRRNILGLNITVARPDNVGAACRIYRQAMRMTQKAMETATGLSASSISYVELNHERAAGKLKDKVGDYLQQQAPWLMENVRA